MIADNSKKTGGGGAGVPPLSRRVREINPSPTLAIDGRFKELREQGVDVISFGAGQPDYPTPAHIKQAGIGAIEDNFTGYTPVAGIPPLKEAIRRKLKRENGISYEPNEIVVTVGAKHALYNAFMALCEPGDEVIVPSPYWVSYPEQVKLAGAVPVFAPTDPGGGFRLTADAVERVITRKTKAIIINSPNNPTGAVYRRDDLAEIGELARRHNFWVVTDDIYEHLVYGDARAVSIASLPGMAERTVLINGVSKAYAMTGWRMGFAAGPAGVIAAMAALQGHSTSNITSITQAAAVAALDGPQDELAAMVKDYEGRRDYVVERLRAMPGVECGTPGGAFYVFAGVEGLLGRTLGGRTLESADDVADVLLDEARIAVVPGTGFGAPGHIRLSYATAMDDIEKGLDRMAEVLERAV